MKRKRLRCKLPIYLVFLFNSYMPLTDKGKKIMSAMKSEYGKDGEKVFYASRNKWVIKGVEKQIRTIKKHIK